MSIQSHLYALNDKHQKLESMIQDAYSHHYPDEQVKELKLEKLRVREEMEYCRKRMRKHEHLQEECAA